MDVILLLCIKYIMTINCGIPFGLFDQEMHVRFKA